MLALRGTLADWSGHLPVGIGCPRELRRQIEAADRRANGVVDAVATPLLIRRCHPVPRTEVLAGAARENGGSACLKPAGLSVDQGGRQDARHQRTTSECLAIPAIELGP
jgi:hypothetical protein